jgi:hypothetical protein
VDETKAGKRVMPIDCDVILQWNATPGQLRALGAALWQWYRHAQGNTDVYQHLNNQGLADLLAGRLPVQGPTTRQTERRGIHFGFRDETSQDSRATADRLRRELPSEGVEDILVGGESWALNAVPLRNGEERSMAETIPLEHNHDEP